MPGLGQTWSNTLLIWYLGHYLVMSIAVVLKQL